MKHRWLMCQNILLKNNLAQMARFLKRRIPKDKGEHSEPSRRFRCGDKISSNDLIDFEKNEALGAIFTHEPEGLFDVCAIIERYKNEQ
ncbi:hypothetical protein [Streptococcus intermedius]|uniref:hypothetical protein n=2 Tax=Streptococcus intermedius TaxID=1338 RepID=UPI0020012A94|nr:hypothetical protein [Streptococcus intermedius]